MFSFLTTNQSKHFPPFVKPLPSTPPFQCVTPHHIKKLITKATNLGMKYIEAEVFNWCKSDYINIKKISFFEGNNINNLEEHNRMERNNLQINEILQKHMQIFIDNCRVKTTVHKKFAFLRIYFTQLSRYHSKIRLRKSIVLFSHKCGYQITW